MIYITVCHRPYLARFNEDFQRIMDVSRLFVFFNKNLLAQTPASEPATALSFSNQKVTGQNISLSPLLSIFFWARGRAAGLSRGIFLGAMSILYQAQPQIRAQKGYTAHIPRAGRKPQQLILVQPKPAHIERLQVRRSQQHSSDPVPARRKSCAPQRKSYWPKCQPPA